MRNLTPAARFARIGDNAAKALQVEGASATLAPTGGNP
jgi:hypothetical protein